MRKQNLVRALFRILHTNGPHPGLSDESDCSSRILMSIGICLAIPLAIFRKRRELFLELVIKRLIDIFVSLFLLIILSPLLIIISLIIFITMGLLLYLNKKDRDLKVNLLQYINLGQ